MRAKNNLLLQALDERLDAFRAQFITCQRDFSEEAVHDLRVASRRLLAGLGLARVFSPKPSLQKAHRALKRLLDELDELRDVQVMRAKSTDLLAAFPQTEGMIKRLKKQEKKLLQAAENELKKLQLTEISRRFERVRAQLQEEIPPKGFDARLLSVVDESFARAKQAEGRVEAGEAASIHRLRIAFKKFRYTVEMTRPLLRNHPEALLRTMHEYQSKMGDVQDAEVLLQALTEFAKREPKADFAPVRAAVESRRADSIAEFMKGRDELSTFWRAQPEGNFPWEAADETVHRPSRNRGEGRERRSRSRQPKTTDRQRTQKDGEDRARPEATGGTAGPDPDQPLPAGGSDGGDPAQGL